MRYGTLLRTCVLVPSVLLAAASIGWGQDWAVKMFDETTHDFGTVARGAKVEHTFTVENIYEEDAHIASVSSSCGCTTPTVSRRSLKTWEKAQITASVDTRGYYGRKDATITVTFDRPYQAEVRLNVYTYIRSDVVVQPGSVQFGTVAQGAGGQHTVSVSYAGRPDWQIVDVETHHPHLDAHVEKTNAPIGQVVYNLVVTLKKEAPVGRLTDHLVLVTNDRRVQASHVPVAVEGVVVASLSARPTPLSAVVDTGGKLTKRLFVQGQRPFQITGVECADDRFAFALPTSARSLHLLPVTFTAGDAPGKVRTKIRIRTDLPGGQTLEVPVDIRVMPSGPTSF